MKKLILVLLTLFTLSSYGQAEFEKIAITENVSSLTAPNVNVQEVDGVVNYRPISSMPYAQADTGVLTFTGLTTNSATTINIGAVNGQIVDNETNPLAPVRTSVTYAGVTGVTVTTVGSGSASYVMLSSAGVISFQNTFPTSAERKAKIWLGKVAHPAGVITLVVNEPDYVTSPIALTRDLFQDIGPYINNGIFPYPNGANLNINITGGTVTGDGINFVTSRTDPNHFEALPSILANFVIRTQTGGATTAVNTITPSVYDNAGTITAIGGGAGATTIQHVEYTPGLGYSVQLGQTVYATFSEAVGAVGKETFIRWSNLVNNAIPIGVIVVNKSATALNNTAQAMFFKANKTGDFFGAQAGVSTGTLQSTYLNSVVPQIVTTAGLGALTIKSGSGSDSDNILIGQNGAGSNTLEVKGNGNINTLGRLTVGTFIPTETNIRVNRDITGAVSSNSVLLDGVIKSDVTTSAFLQKSIAITQASSFTLPDLYHNYASQGVFGAGSTVTNQYGFYADVTLLGATNNYGFYGAVSLGGNRWNAYMNGTAPNYFNGNVSIGTTSQTGKLLVVTGIGNTVSVTGQPTASVVLGNLGTSTNEMPAVIGKTTNNTGLTMMASSEEVNTTPDMRFEIRRNTNTDYTDRTTTGWRFTRFGTTVIDILRNGNTTFIGSVSGVAATTANHFVIKSQSDLKADLASPIFTGNPTAPTATAGDNDTSIATTAFVLANARPYKTYYALMTQSGTGAPTATVIENTLGGTVVWTRSITGEYTGTLTGAFTNNKTGTTMTGNFSNVIVSATRATDNTVIFRTSTSGTLSDNSVTNATLEIRVYP